MIAMLAILREHWSAPDPLGRRVGRGSYVAIFAITSEEVREGDRISHRDWFWFVDEWGRAQKTGAGDLRILSPMPKGWSAADLPKSQEPLSVSAC